MLDGLPTTPVYSGRRDRFVNSAFPIVGKVWPQNQSIFMTNKFESKCLQKFSFLSKTGKIILQKDDSYLEQPSRHFCQQFLRRTTQQTFLAILNLASQQKTTKLYFSSQVKKQFKLLTVPFKPIRRCLRSDKLVICHV